MVHVSDLSDQWQSGNEPTSPLFAGIGELCRGVVETAGVDGAAVALLTPRAHTRELAHATDAVARQLDDLQFVLGEGPCLDSFHHRRSYLCGDLAALSTDRWPTFLAEAEATGARAVFAFPVIGVYPIGVLELYRHTPGNLDPIQHDAAQRGADAAAATMRRNWSRYAGNAGDTAQDLGGDLAVDDDADPGAFSHSNMHLAAGMTAAQLAIAPQQALDRIRGLAFRQNRSIDILAGDIVYRRYRITDDDAPYP